MAGKCWNISEVNPWDKLFPNCKVWWPLYVWLVSNDFINFISPTMMMIHSLGTLFPSTFNHKDISWRSLIFCNSVVGLTALGWPHIYLPALIFPQKLLAAAAAALIFRQNRTCWVLHLVFNSFTPLLPVGRLGVQWTVWFKNALQCYLYSILFIGGTKHPVGCF